MRHADHTCTFSPANYIEKRFVFKRVSYDDKFCSVLVMRALAHFILRCWLLNCFRSSFGSTNIQNGNSGGHVLKESSASLGIRDDLVTRIQLSGNHIHEIVIVVKQRNMEHLTRLMHDVSDPSSPNYGQFISGEQVAAMTMNPEARDAIVSYLTIHGAAVTSESLTGDYITAQAPISVWERILDTEFFTFHQRQSDRSIEKIVRAERYSIPMELDEHIDCVLNTIEIPIRRSRGQRKVESLAAIETKTVVVSTDGPSLDPSKLRQYYNLTKVYGSILSTQAAFASSDTYFSQATTYYVLKQDGIYDRPSTIGVSISEHPRFNFTQANLNIQYLMTISRGSTTTLWSGLSLLAWLKEVASTPNPPMVLSISYKQDERTTTDAEHIAFTTQAMKLGVMGVTIIAAAGDDGAVSTSNCEYRPVYPASNPYVTAIGATAVSTYRAEYSYSSPNCNLTLIIYLFMIAGSRIEHS